MVVVGAPQHATGGPAYVGQAYVYVRSGGAWSGLSGAGEGAAEPVNKNGTVGS